MADVELLEGCFKVWVAADTWHTGHSGDDLRFHIALNRAHTACGIGITADEFERAIDYSIQKHGVQVDTDTRQRRVDDYTSRADTITRFIRDVSTAR